MELIKPCWPRFALWCLEFMCENIFEIYREPNGEDMHTLEIEWYASSRSERSHVPYTVDLGPRS